MFDKNDLESLSKTDLSTINKNKLNDLSQIVIDTNLPIQQRLINFLNDVHNPYCFLIGSSVVKIEFSNNGHSLQVLLKNHFIDQQNHIFDQ